jgi:DNA-binding Lrp family transcriptional regulator
MIRGITVNDLDTTDGGIVEVLQKHKNGCKIGPIVRAVRKSEGAIRYRLLTLEALGIVKATRERGSTTYSLGIDEE